MPLMIDELVHHDEVHATTPAGALLTCAFAVNRMAEHLGRIYDVSAREVLAIMDVAISGPFSASELADRLYLSRGAVTGMVRRLTEQGWLESAPDRFDGRRIVIRATARPHRLLQVWTSQFGGDISRRVGEENVSGVASAVAQCSAELERHRSTLQRLGPAEVRALMHLP
jgi:DNA-binding MarR family transcriptional regulator